MIPFLFHINRPLSAVFDDWSPGLSRRFVFGVLLHLVSDRRSYYSEAKFRWIATRRAEFHISVSFS